MIKLVPVPKIVLLSTVILLAMVTLSTSASLASGPSAAPQYQINQPAQTGCTENDTTVYKKPWMIYGDDPTRMHILFETETGVDNDSNHIKIEFDQGGVSCSRDYDKMTIDLMEDRRLWTFSCSRLQPNRTYNFTIYYRKWYSSLIDYCWHHQSGWFTTPPPTDAMVRYLDFYAYGDTRDYTQNPPDSGALATIARKIYEHHNIHNNLGAFIIHTGDIVPNGGAVAHDEKKDGHDNIIVTIDPWVDNFFKVGTIQSMLAQLPIFTTIGNHDFACDACTSPGIPPGCGDCQTGYVEYQNTKYEYETQPNYYYHYFKYPMYGGRASGSSDLGKFYYSFKWGPAVFYSLSTYPMHDYCTFSPNLTTDSDQYKWLEKELQDSMSDWRPWKIAFFHAPVYSANGSMGCGHQLIDNYVPLFKKYGVDLVLMGHEHYYGRVTYPKQSDLAQIKDGITYLVLGGGGAGLEDYCCPQDMDIAQKIYHFAYFDIDGDEMDVSIIDMNSDAFDTFTINKTPRADFNVTGARTGLAPLDVQFENLSTGYITNYLWDFGDGSPTSTEISPTHDYDVWGYYTVTLTVENNLNSDTLSKPNYIRVGYDAEFAASPRKGDAPLTVEFEPMYTASEYSRWDFGDGTSQEISGTVSHTYDGAQYGNLTVAHTLGDAHGNRITLSKPGLIKIEPYADFSLDVPQPDQPYYFQFYDESQGGGGVFSWDWVFGDQTGSGEQNPTHDYSFWGPDTLEVELDVVFNDDSGGVLRDNAKKKVVVPAPDEYDAEFTATPVSGLPPLTVMFTPSSDYAYNLWDFGDGNYSDDPGLVAHTYGDSGTFTVTHTVGNGPSSNSSLEKPDLIKVSLYDDFCAHPRKGAPGLTVEFTPFHDYPINEWNFGDGTTLLASGVVSHTYDSDPYGNLTVAHTVEDSRGYRSTMTKPDLIKIEPYAEFTWDVPDPARPYFFQFYDESQGGGGVFSWDWVFGDQTGSGDQNPAHDYTFWGPDTLEVELDVVFNDDSGGVLRDETKKTVIVPAPDSYDAGFTAIPVSGPAPLTVTFKPTTDYPYNYWDFGDGNHSVEPGCVTNIYEKPGTYTVEHITGYGSWLNSSLAQPDYIRVVTITLLPAVYRMD